RTRSRAPPYPGPLGSTPRSALSSRRARVGSNSWLPRPLSSTRPGVVVSSRREWDGLASLAASRAHPLGRALARLPTPARSARPHASRSPLGERAWVRTRGSHDPFRPRDLAWSFLHGGSGIRTHAGI